MKMLRLFGLTVLIVPCLALRDTHHLVHLSKDGKAVSQDIIHDMEENTVLVTIGDVSEYENKFPTVNFHDFNTGYVAFKDIKHRICSLSLTPFPKATPELYKMGITNITFEYTVTYDHTPMTYASVSEVAGSKLADFCKNYVTFMSVLTRQERKKRDLDTPEPCSRNCLICILQSDLEEYQSLNQRAFG